MCGILGYVKRGLPESGWEQAFSSIRHRGPDSNGSYADDDVILGTQRLKIQDLSAMGDQPMYDSSKRYCIVFNGEIYNHHELRNQLLRQGYSFQSHSDTETVLNTFLAYGAGMLNKLNGIFAFVIYDKERKILFGARDPMGVKPFYYFKKNTQFAFGSELKSLIFLPEFDTTIHYSALANYMNFLWSPGEVTPFRYVNKLLPGHYFKYELNVPESLQIESYYDIPFNGAREFYNDNVWIETIDRRLETSVKGQLLSDVPVGCFLSGGIDSSVIVAQARKHYNGELHCFTIKGPNDGQHEGFRDDLTYARQAARHLGVTLHEVDGSVQVLDMFDKMVWHLDEPQGDIAPIYVYKVSETAASMGVHVLLSGAGGDDVFTGYRRHQALSYDRYLSLTPPFVFPLLSRYLQGRDPNNPTIRRLSKFLKRNNASAYERLVGYFEWFPIEENYHLFHKDIAESLHAYTPESYLNTLLEKIEQEDSLLNKMLYLDLKTFLVDHNLNYTDKMGMAASVEIRVPYLDIPLVNTSVKLPTDLKLRNTQTKYILRKIGEKYLPGSIINRPKTGFGGPVRKWINTDLANMVDDRLSPYALSKYGIFDPTSMQKLIRDTRAGRIDGAYTLLTAMAIQSWMEQFYNKSHHA